MKIAVNTSLSQIGYYKKITIHAYILAYNRDNSIWEKYLQKKI
jgi:hypothetical protein